MVADAEPADGDARLTIALERSWKAVGAQRDLLSDFRGRSATLLGAASVTVGVAAGLGGKDGLTLSDGWARWSIAWFAASVVCATYVLVPRGWVFESDPNSFDWYFHNATTEELRSSLLADAVEHYNTNSSKLGRLGTALTVQVIALGLTSLGVLSFSVGR